MSLQRISIARPGASAAELVTLARWGDAFNLAGMWLGDPNRRGPVDAPELDDSYLTAAAAGVATATRDIRIGLLLGVGDERHPLRLAEDLSVIDQMSGGRTEVGLLPPSEGHDEWTGRVTTLLNAWNGVAVPGKDEEIHVLPAPVQPTIPVLAPVEDDASDGLEAGHRRLAAGAPLGGWALRRTVLVVPVELDDGGVQGWLASDPVERVMGLRADAEAAEADEIMLTFDGELTEEDVRALGVVVVTGVRGNVREARSITADGWRWLLEGEPIDAGSS